LHQTISEAVAGPVDTHLTDGISIADIPTDRIGMVISGHIHKRQNLLLGRVHIPGSPLQLTFGEAGEDKAFSLIDTTTWTVETIPTNAPRFFKFDYPDMDLSGVNTMRDFVRVTYDREHADAIQRLTEQYPRIDFVENAKDETIFRTTEKAADDDQQLLREYLRHASLDGMDEEMLLETGLELLAGEQA